MKQIAVGVNGTGGSLAAVDWAVKEAASRGAALQLVNASLWQEHQVAAVRRPRDVMAELARDILEQARDRARTAHPEVDTSVEETVDAPSRLLLARAADAELLVLGSHRTADGSGFLSGHVAQEVLAAAERPVVLVREDDGADATGPVVVGLDVERPADEVLDFAFDFAARRELPLRIVSAWHSVFPHHHTDSDVSEARDRIRAAVSVAVSRHRTRHAHLDISEDVVHERPAHALLAAASDAGLLVVGRRVRHAPTGSRVGATTQTALHHAACPVAVVSHP
ncbi:universal stress protein [Streptomyces sp. NPDC004435]|uniref:universal stress protein n=1 Tax=Streptomyces sp. NPDC004435 TaxID=3364701 RepID=UPI0036C12276